MRIDNEKSLGKLDLLVQNNLLGPKDQLSKVVLLINKVRWLIELRCKVGKVVAEPQ